VSDTTSDARSDVERTWAARVLVAAVVMLGVLAILLILATVLPAPAWVFWTAVGGIGLFAVAAGVLAFADARSTGTSVLVSLWRAVRAAASFFFGMIF
jgi:hypothetical protein